MAESSSERLARLGGIGLVNLATLAWATNMALGCWLRDDIGPLTLAVSRFAIASMLFATLLRHAVAERCLGLRFPDRRWVSRRRGEHACSPAKWAWMPSP